MVPQSWTRLEAQMNEHFGSCITLIMGMSTATLPVLRQQYQHVQFNLVAIDGGLYADVVHKDLAWFYNVGKPTADGRC